MERRLTAIIAIDVVGFSRLMGEDESGTLERLKSLRRELIQPTINARKGRTVKLMGDGLLAEFPSIVEAVLCAVDIQQSMLEIEADLADERRIRLRIGINLGDIIVEGADIFGDGVNIAARLEGFAKPGGICVSGKVYEEIRNKLPTSFEDLGEQMFKNIRGPIRVYGWANVDQIPHTAVIEDYQQEIRYCTSLDGTSLAYSIAGKGQPLLKSAHFMTHLEHDWNSPTFGPFFHEMAARYTFIRYDQRGNGLSERHPNGLSFELFVQDVEAVADAAGLERFAIYGLSQGSAVAIDYAVRHPERVSALILHSGFARGRYNRGKLTEDDRMKLEALITLVRTGWGQDNPAFRQMFSTMFIPEAKPDMVDSFDEIMRISTDPDIAAQIFEVIFQIELSDILHRVQAPTLIINGRRDVVCPFEEGRLLAAGIPNAKLVELDTANHLPLQHESVWPRIIAEINRFLSENPA